jgi:predicted nucleotidyltransferase
MQRDALIQTLKRALQALGLKELSLFGSTARGDAKRSSDMDIAVKLDDAAHIDLFRYAAISDRLSEMLGVPVDLITEPARNPRMQAEIDRDRLRVY